MIEITMLDCIKRVPTQLNKIILNIEATYKEMLDYLGDNVSKIDEIVLIGSGTSATSAQTAQYFAEKASGIRVRLSLPNEFLNSETYRNKNALYVFISQTGTSTITKHCLDLVKKNNFFNVAISEAKTTPIASLSDAFIDMNCGHEEYPYRTIGYSTSVMTIMLLGMEIGLKRNHITKEQYKDYLSNAQNASNNILDVIDKTMLWLDHNRRKMLRSDGIIINGSGALHGVALEAAVKLWETLQVISVGYELEEGIHGPNYGYNHRHCIICLNDGGFDNDKAIALAKYMKIEKENGFIIGKGAIDEEDLSFDPVGMDFACLEFAAAVQVLSYRLTVDQGKDLRNRPPNPHGNMNKYFKSHGV